MEEVKKEYVELSKQLIEKAKRLIEKGQMNDDEKFVVDRAIHSAEFICSLEERNNNKYFDKTISDLHEQNRYTEKLSTRALIVSIIAMAIPFITVIYMMAYYSK